MDESLNGADLIAIERQRQVDVEGWTPEHDRAHRGHSLTMAALCYLTPQGMRINRPDGAPIEWPWARRFWKPSPGDRVRELVKAGALIAAEIDRLQAAAQTAVEVA